MIFYNEHKTILTLILKKGPISLSDLYFESKDLLGIDTSDSLECKGFEELIDKLNQISDYILENINYKDNQPYYTINKGKIRELNDVLKKYKMPHYGLVEEDDFIGSEEIVAVPFSECVDGEKLKYLRKNCSCEVVLPSGERIKKEFDAFYITDYDFYMISEEEYYKLEKLGLPLFLCIKKFSSIKDIINFKNNLFSEEWNEQSIYSIYGYTVKKDAKITINQRRDVLDFVISKYPEYNAYRTIGFLKWLITEKIGIKRYSHAIHEWASDIKYIADKYDIEDIAIKNFLRNKLK